ncbi:MAG: ATP-binding protein [Erythrobacter sp.]|jgi:AAA15 family ATPase/GTPase|uniref:ATP-dependent nuclease n=1 Tax=Qipengyuania pacifica TaxID=2860199 RepID=UPI0035C7E4D0|nr:ATP-binding protein [Erythrobacter sp.]
MRFESFTIENFKGIQKATIDVDAPDPKVFSLVGLNESGKTTILEAINYFVAADVELQKIYNIEHASVNKSGFVPKSKKFNFNGDVIIAARLSLDDDDYDAVAERFVEHGHTLDRSSLPKVITVTHNFRFKNSDFEKAIRTFPTSFKAFKGRGKTSKNVSNTHVVWSELVEILEGRIPQVLYFPTFLFDLPEKIYIEEIEGEKPVNKYYRKLLQDILDSLHEGLNIQDHIVDRIRSSDTTWSWFSFLQTDRREQVNHVLLKASSKVTSVIMQSWKKVFSRGFDSKRIEFEYGHDEEVDAIYIKIFLVDVRSAEKYEISDRSLGFRWFFCFWMFTYFRVLRSDANGVVFLFDEPASNLHARAQEELLASMQGLAEGSNIVIYSTHSHYLINPNWLDKAYIVKNEALNYEGIEDEFSNTGETNITAVKYRTFVGRHPNQRTYCLPVLDALDYRPSELMLERPSLLVEGKADFAFFQLAFLGRQREFSVVPGGGAQSLGPIIALLTGWGFRNAVLLDDDKEGKDAQRKYIRDWQMSESAIKRIGDFGKNFASKSLETVLLTEIGDTLRDHFDTTEVDKERLRIFLAEKLAASDASFFTEPLLGFADAVFNWASDVLEEPQ